MHLDIRDVDPQGADALALLQEASIDARALYPELFVGTVGLATNEPLAERDAYVVAYLDGRPVACGAIRPRSLVVAEIRRMYVHRDDRRRGLARVVLQHLEREARSLGYQHLLLETGHRQLPAMKLYEACGYVRIEPFGEYVDDPTSICYARDIDTGDR